VIGSNVNNVLALLLLEPNQLLHCHSCIFDVGIELLSDCSQISFIIVYQLVKMSPCVLRFALLNPDLYFVQQFGRICLHECLNVKRGVLPHNKRDYGVG